MPSKNQNRVNKLEKTLKKDLIFPIDIFEGSFILCVQVHVLDTKYSENPTSTDWPG